MRFFPALTEEFTSLLPPAELLRHVQASVQQAREFSGRVAGSQFTISRVIDYRNSMLPRISGEVTAGPMGGSRLRLRHQLHPFVLAFGAMWLGIVGSVVGGMGLTLVQGAFRAVGEGPVWPNLIPVACWWASCCCSRCLFGPKCGSRDPGLSSSCGWRRWRRPRAPRQVPTNAESRPFVSSRAMCIYLFLCFHNGTTA
jgi:hypothetical protein